MTTDENIPAAKLFRATEIPCEVRHSLIVRLWELLPLGDYFVLENDHDPVPLLRQFRRFYPDCFSWDYLERGPRRFRVRITRLKESESAS